MHGLAASHDLLVEENWRGVLLEELVRHQLAVFAEIGGARLTVDGPKVMLTAQASQAIGLALHELGTNAIKHGSWSLPQGRVAVSWAFEPASFGGGALRINWIERHGPRAASPEVKGFGHVVIETMAEQATGGQVSMDFNHLGLAWSLVIPRECLVAQ